MLPTAIVERLAESFGGRVGTITPVSGGMIHKAARVATSDGYIFVKWGSETIAPYQTEAEGLGLLQATQTLRVPEVLAIGDDTCPFLALEWLNSTTPQDLVSFTRRFAVNLARLHREGISPTEQFGLSHDNFTGPLPQTNRWNHSWPEFYRGQRLLPQIRLLQQMGTLTVERTRLLFAVCDRLEVLLEGLNEPPSLLHGDLWSGNYLCLEGDIPAVFDPAVYYGPREIEIAYIELFGGFPSGFSEAYNAAYPLDSGYIRRRPLHQLYSLLVHYILFVEPYGAKIEVICRNLLSTGTFMPRTLSPTTDHLLKTLHPL